MKEKIIFLVIGLLLGAVIASGAFFVYSKATSSCNCGNQTTQTQRNTPPERPSGDSSQNEQGGQPPEKPGSNNSESSDNTQNNSDSKKSTN